MRTLVFPKALMCWLKCQDCKLGAWAHKHVLGRGETGELLFLGEAPGRSEELLGLPFVGPAGKLLDDALETVRGKKFFANLLACRPSDKQGGPNRAPELKEVQACWGRVQETIRFASPKGIVLLGRVPAMFWEEMKGQEIFPGPVLKAMHPAALLRRGGKNAVDYNEYVANFRNFAETVL